MNAIRRSASLAVLTASFSFAADSVQAGLDGEIQDMFNGMVVSNTTNAQISMGQRRGIITGGSIHLRTRNVSTGPLLTVDPPRLRGGTGACGSIDLLGGSFSIMSTEQLKQLPRAVLANAGAMAVSVALNAVSPALEDKMSQWLKTINEYSQFELASCELAQKLVGPESAAGQAIDSTFRSAAAALGGDSSNTTARLGVSGENPGATIPEATKAEIQPGNILWRAMSQQKTNQWFEHGDDETKEAIMSLVGTIIICAKGANCEGQESGTDPLEDGAPRYLTIFGVLGLKDLIDGTNPERPGNGVKMHRCRGNKSADGCLNVARAEPVTNFKGLNQRVLDITLGADGNLGIIDRIRTDPSGPTSNEEAFLVNTGKFGGMILALSKRDATAAKDFVNRFSRLIAAELAQNLVERMLSAAEIALGGESNQTYLQEQRKLLQDARQKLNWDKQDIKSQADEHALLLAYYQNQRDSMPPIVLPASPRG